MAAAMAGFHELTGWADRAPAGPFSAYTDYVSPRFAVPVLIQAIDERRRTGRGGYIDFAQAEAALHFLTPALLDASVNGHVMTRQGNDDPAMAPHGTYPCTGEDRWVAVACRDDRDWRALAGIVGRADLADLGGAARITRRRELDAVVAAWTATRTPAEVEQALIGVGVPAHGVQHSPECATDPQLDHLGHFVVVEHPHHGTVTVEASRTALSATPSALPRGAPVLGQHTIDAMTELLGYDDERLATLLAAGALE
jgi:crotonobetainyl-CoA:carnitine CoA-transferase CaiB-like acyl-CoA transferase